jgi:outer membrane protein assembly factor BamB
MVRNLFAAAAICAASAAMAQPPSLSGVSGWWRATLTHGGESRDIWLHFHDRNGKLIAGFGNPTIGIEDTPLSAVAIKPGSVELTNLGWSLHREKDGSLTGIVPESLIPVYKMHARFTPSGKPPLPALSRPSQRAPAPVWRQDVGAPIHGGLALDPARKRIIAATDSGRVSALNASDGKTAWSMETGTTIRATPLINGRSLFVSTDTALLKLEAATGRRIWSADLGEGKGPRLPITDPNSRYDEYASSAVVAGESVYVGSRDGCVRRLSVASGTLLKRFCATDMVTATPVVDGKRVYFASFDNHVYSADIDSGRIVWRHDTQGAIPRDLAIVAGRIVAGSRSYELTALDKSTGRAAWTHYYWYSWVDAVPNAVGRTMYIGSSDSLRVFAFDSVSGHKLWETVVPGWTWAKPAVGRRTVYAAVTGTATPYMGPRAGGFAAIDRGSGKLRWLIASDKPANAPEYGFASAPVIADGMVYAADLAGRVMAFRDE